MMAAARTRARRDDRSPRMTTLAPGTPYWVDLTSPDPDAAAAFYGELFGWTNTVATEPEAGGHRTFSLDGKAVAGVGPLQEGQHVAWTTFMSTVDADATVAAVDAAGGKVLMPAIDILDYGRMALFADPAGAVFGVWQAGRHSGGEVFNVPGALTWNELTTPDVAGATEFYPRVFGWTPSEMPMGDATYTMWNIEERPIGGLMPMASGDWPADAPPQWTVYFAVADTDATAAKAAELGGTVLTPPTDMMAGRFAVIADPHGATFSVIAPAEAS
jgi:predicted enzyme related to lactoylglutathione lyase